MHQFSMGPHFDDSLLSVDNLEENCPPAIDTRVCFQDEFVVVVGSVQVDASYYFVFKSLKASSCFSLKMNGTFGLMSEV